MAIQPAQTRLKICVPFRSFTVTAACVQRQGLLLIALARSARPRRAMAVVRRGAAMVLPFCLALLVTVHAAAAGELYKKGQVSALHCVFSLVQILRSHGTAGKLV